MLIVFVSDDDDWSRYDTNENGETGSECTNSKDTLIPVPDVLLRLKALKSDPSKVLTATFGGDLPAEIATDAARSQFLEWRCNVMSPTKVTTHACTGPTGAASTASRMIALSEQNGRYGTFHNICADGGIPEGLKALATRVGTELMRTCLPSRVLRTDILQPWVTSSDGTTRPLSQSEFDIVHDTACPAEADHLAIRALTKLKPGDSIAVSYDLTLP